MTSLGVDLQEEESKKPGGFIYTWSIRNFSHCQCPVKENEVFITSPGFAVEFLGDTTWNLEIYCIQPLDKDVINCILSSNKRSEIFSFALSIRTTNGTFEEKYRGIYNPPPGSIVLYDLLSHEELNEPGTYLENDTLTLRCHMWKEEAPSQVSGYCYARTKIKVSKINYVWTLNNIAVPNSTGYKFKQTTEIPSFICNLPKLKMHVLNEGSLGEDAIHFGIQMPEQAEDVFLVVIIQILDEVGKIVHSARGEHFFECVNNDKIWDFPIISKRMLYLSEQIYVPSGKLTLQCEFLFSGDHEVCSVTYGKTDTPKSKHVALHLPSDGYKLWKENLHTFFKDEKISDLVVRTSNREFHVHRAILCAQSEVFLTMFQNKMKESITGVIEIEDLEDDTVAKMLLYLYTNTLEDIDSSSAQKLYYAADKYRIKSLLRICSHHLMCNLDTSNVCEILVLADMHQDRELKLHTMVFIQAKAPDIMNSEGWKSLMKTNSSLTLEIMHGLLCRKFIKDK